MCYSASATDPISTTHFGVYRPSAAVSGFTLVSASNFTVPRVGNASSYSCIQLPLSKERQFLVQPGDVVAVCVRYIGKGRLGLVGTQTSNILGNEGINCLSPGLAMPPIVSQSMGAYLLNLIPHVNLGKCRGVGGGEGVSYEALWLFTVYSREIRHCDTRYIVIMHVHVSMIM